MTRTSKLTKESFPARVEIDARGCWIWQGAKKNPGNQSFAYGWVGFCGTQMNAHRASWLVHNGQIPAGMFVCHKCDVPLCVNPEHLFLGTASDNMLDMWAKRRHPNPNAGRIGSLSSKLTLTQVQEIRHQITCGEKQRDIASKYGVKQATISHIKTGKNWSRYA
jgi:hypothetical protein